MLKFATGFIFGMSFVGWALAQNMPTPSGNVKSIENFGSINIARTTFNAGVNPDGDMAPIKVDAEGHVICAVPK